MWVVVSEDGSQRIPFGRGHARRVQAEVTAAALMGRWEQARFAAGEVAAVDFGVGATPDESTPAAVKSLGEEINKALRGRVVAYPSMTCQPTGWASPTSSPAPAAAVSREIQPGDRVESVSGSFAGVTTVDRVDDGTSLIWLGSGGVMWVATADLRLADSATNEPTVLTQPKPVPASACTLSNLIGQRFMVGDLVQRRDGEAVVVVSIASHDVRCRADDGGECFVHINDLKHCGLGHAPAPEGRQTTDADSAPFKVGDTVLALKGWVLERAKISVLSEITGCAMVIFAGGGEASVRIADLRRAE